MISQREGVYTYSLTIIDTMSARASGSRFNFWKLSGSCENLLHIGLNCQVTCRLLENKKIRGEHRTYLSHQFKLVEYTNLDIDKPLSFAGSIPVSPNRHGINKSKNHPAQRVCQPQLARWCAWPEVKMYSSVVVTKAQPRVWNLPVTRTF